MPSALEKETATRSSTLAWRIPRPGEPGGLRPVGSQGRTRLSSQHTAGHLSPVFLKGSLGLSDRDVPARSYFQQISRMSTVVDACCYASRKLISGELEKHKNLFF